MTLGLLLMMIHVLLLGSIVVVALKQRLVQTGGHVLDGRDIVGIVVVVAQGCGFYIHRLLLLSREQFGQSTHQTETGTTDGLSRRTIVMVGRIHLTSTKAGEIIIVLLMVGRIAVQQVGQGIDVNPGQIDATVLEEVVLSGRRSLTLLLLDNLTLERRHFHVQIKELSRNIGGRRSGRGTRSRAHALGFGHDNHTVRLAFTAAALFFLFLASLVSLGHVRAAVGVGHVVPKGLRALFATQERFRVHPLPALDIAPDKAAVLVDVFDHVADNIGFIGLGLGLFVLVQHGADERAQPLVARVEVELFALLVMVVVGVGGRYKVSDACTETK